MERGQLVEVGCGGRFAAEGAGREAFEHGAGIRLAAGQHGGNAGPGIGASERSFPFDPIDPEHGIALFRILDLTGAAGQADGLLLERPLLHEDEFARAAGPDPERQLDHLGRVDRRGDLFVREEGAVVLVDRTRLDEGEEGPLLRHAGDSADLHAHDIIAGVEIGGQIDGVLARLLHGVVEVETGPGQGTVEVLLEPAVVLIPNDLRELRVRFVSEIELLQPRLVGPGGLPFGILLVEILVTQMTPLDVGAAQLGFEPLNFCQGFRRGLPERPFPFDPVDPQRGRRADFGLLAGGGVDLVIELHIAFFAENEAARSAGGDADGHLDRLRRVGGAANLEGLHQGEVIRTTLAAAELDEVPLLRRVLHCPDVETEHVFARLGFFDLVLRLEPSRGLVGRQGDELFGVDVVDRQIRALLRERIV